jgi:hypothetical protein
LFVGNTLMDNEEEAFVLPVAHLHWRNFGRPALPETGWLYITPGSSSVWRSETNRMRLISRERI